MINNKKQIIQILSQILNDLKKNYGVIKIYLIGSYAKNNFSNESDIDLLIEIDDDHRTLFNRLKLKNYLEELLEKKVDISYIDSLHPIIEKRVKLDMINV